MHMSTNLTTKEILSLVKADFETNKVLLSRKLVIPEHSILDEAYVLEITNAIELSLEVEVKEFLIICLIKSILANRESYTLKNSSYTLNYATRERIYDLIERYITIISAPIVTYYIAVIHFLERKYTSALEMFTSVAQTDCPAIYGWDQGVKTLKLHRNTNSKYSNIFKTDTSISWIKKFEKNNRISILIGADSRYFKAFREDQLKSFKEYSEELNLIFHIVNPCDESLKIAKSICDASPTVYVSYENADTSDKAFYAGIRFLRLEYFMDVTNSGIITLDADCPLRPKLDFFEELYINDLGVAPCKGPGGYVPWRRFAAGILYANNTDNGRNFASMLAENFKRLWKEQHGSNWWLDQTAIFLSIMELNLSLELPSTFDFSKFNRKFGHMPFTTSEAYKLKTLSNT